MRYSEKEGYAALAEVLREPLAVIGPVESVIEGVMVTLADNGCQMSLPCGVVEYVRLVERHRI
jgi:hypothetical protein